MKKFSAYIRPPTTAWMRLSISCISSAGTGEIGDLVQRLLQPLRFLQRDDPRLRPGRRQRRRHHPPRDAQPCRARSRRQRLGQPGGDRDVGCRPRPSGCRSGRARLRRSRRRGRPARAPAAPVTHARPRTCHRRIAGSRQHTTSEDPLGKVSPRSSASPARIDVAWLRLRKPRRHLLGGSPVHGRRIARRPASRGNPIAPAGAFRTGHVRPGHIPAISNRVALHRAGGRPYPAADERHRHPRRRAQRREPDAGLRGGRRAGVRAAVCAASQPAVPVPAAPAARWRAGRRAVPGHLAAGDRRARRLDAGGAASPPGCTGSRTTASRTTGARCNTGRPRRSTATSAPHAYPTTTRPSAHCRSSNNAASCNWRWMNCRRNNAKCCCCAWNRT